MITAPCRICAEPVEFDPEFRLGNADHQITCDRCIARESQMDAREYAIRQRVNRWNKMCPAQFRDTNLDRLPCPLASKQSIAWRPVSTGIGLNLWGHPNTGKTRSMMLTLKREFLKGSSMALFLAGQFEGQLEKRAWRRGPWVENLCAVDLLAFDDFDKCAPMSRDHEKILFSILDRRMSAKLPVLLTHNSTAQVLEYRFRNGEAMVRRIRDFTRSVYFKTNEPSRINSV